MTITVKKSNLKLKADATAGFGPDAGAPATQGTNPAPATMGKLSSSASSAPSSGSYVGAAIMGLIACVLLGALLAIQFIENASYTGMVP